MLLSLRASSSRLGSRFLATTPILRTKALLGPTPEAATPVDLLTKIGRNADKRLTAEAESWDTLNKLWMDGGPAMGSSGLTIKERRYVLWAFSKYSQGQQLADFIHPKASPKKYRGWGPRVQKGKRIWGGKQSATEKYRREA